MFLPPIGGQTVYVFGDPHDLANPDVTLTARVHDECNGSDVFGSDICTCRPYLTHAIEECIRGAQAGGVGLVVYCRKEGRALGEVTKFLVYNARKRQEGGDTANNYFLRTECVAGVQDMRFQELMPDVLHWLGVRRIHRLVSMSNMKYDAIVGSGIEVGERVRIPAALVPADARVEMDAKMAAGYFSDGAVPHAEALRITKGHRHVIAAPPALAPDLLSTARDSRALREHHGRRRRRAFAAFPHRSRPAATPPRASSRRSRAGVIRISRSPITAAGAISRPAASTARASSTGARVLRRHRAPALADRSRGRQRAARRGCRGDLALSRARDDR